MRHNLRKIITGWLLLLVAYGCFRPAIPMSTSPKYPVDIFYENEDPGRAYDVLQALESRQETPLSKQQNVDGRMLSRGNTMQEKELILAKMSLEAKKMGADALLNVRYSYYTTQTKNGYLLTAQAIKYRTD